MNQTLESSVTKIGLKFPYTYFGKNTVFAITFGYNAITIRYMIFLCKSLLFIYKTVTVDINRYVSMS